MKKYILAAILVLVATAAHAQIRTELGGTGASITNTDNGIMTGANGGTSFTIDKPSGTCDGSTFLKFNSGSADGSRFSCDSPAGSGDITDVFNCATGDCSSIALGATDLLDMSGVDDSSLTEGLILPQHATACATGVGEGQVCWEADANILHIGNAAAFENFIPASGFSADATVSATGAVTVADDSHAHTSSSISGLDISDDTNLSASGGIALGGDALSCTNADDDSSTKGCATFPDADFNATDGTVSLAVKTVVDESVGALGSGDCSGTLAHTPTGSGANFDIVAFFEGFKLTQVATNCCTACSTCAADEFSVSGTTLCIGVDPLATSPDVSVTYNYAT